jgi:hypothetical protein
MAWQSTAGMSGNGNGGNNGNGGESSQPVSQQPQGTEYTLQGMFHSDLSGTNSNFGKV